MTCTRKDWQGAQNPCPEYAAMRDAAMLARDVLKVFADQDLLNGEETRAMEALSLALQPTDAKDNGGVAQWVRADIHIALIAEIKVVADKIGNHCVSCGHVCGDPDADLQIIKKGGGISCCPERKIEPLSETLMAMIPSLRGATI